MAISSGVHECCYMYMRKHGVGLGLSDPCITSYFGVLKIGPDQDQDHMSVSTAKIEVKLVIRYL